MSAVHMPGVEPVAANQLARRSSFAAKPKPMYRGTCSCGWRGRPLAKKDAATHDALWHMKHPPGVASAPAAAPAPAEAFTNVVTFPVAAGGGARHG